MRSLLDFLRSKESLAQRREALDAEIAPERLAVLMEYETKLALQNPSLTLMLLEDPAFWDRLSQVALWNVAESSACPDALVARALAEPSWVDRVGDTFLNHLLYNGAIPMEQRRQIFFQSSKFRDSPPTTHFTAGPMIVTTVAEQVVMKRVLRGEPLSEAEQAVLLTLGRPGERLLRMVPNCPLAFLLDHVESDRDRERIAIRPDLPDALRKELLQSTDSVTFGAIPTNPALTLEEFEALMQDPSRHRVLATNRKLPEALAARLAVGPDTVARLALAENPSLPEALQLSFAAHADREIRLRLATNTALVASALELLLRDPDADVRERLARKVALTPERSARFMRSPDAAVRSGLALNPGLAEPEQQVLAMDPAPQVRAALAERMEKEPVLALGVRLRLALASVVAPKDKP